MIVFIPCSGNGCKPDGYDEEWLPRDCLGCGRTSIIGHGRRFRQAHDGNHDSIRVRRGFCKECHHTLTALPFWCVPRALYTALARQEAIGSLVKGLPVEQAAPDCRDPDRMADSIHHPSLGMAAHGKLPDLRGAVDEFILRAHPLCLGFSRRCPHSDRGARSAMLNAPHSLPSGFAGPTNNRSFKGSGIVKRPFNDIYRQKDAAWYP